MKTLYLECNMGAAGDMLMAALLELHPNPQAFMQRMNALGIPGVAVSAASATKCGIVGTHVTVTVHGAEEESHDAAQHHHHEHEHTHDHQHHEHAHEAHAHTHHHHTGMQEITHILEHLHLSEQVRADALAVYQWIAEAESHAHGKPVEQIHFHEVGNLDAVADIVGVCMLIAELAPEKILASPIQVGSGQVHCAHGILPVPAPATAHILRGVPTYGGSVRGELCTPTGAALLRHFVSDFGAMPVMQVAQIGYGMGKKDFEQANCVRAMLGETAEARESITELCCNLDDMTPEAIGFATERLREHGALDVFTTAVQMKKSRPGILLTCMCRMEQREELLRLMFKHTTTLGVREHVCNRYTLHRAEHTVQTEYGAVRVKQSSGWGICREKAEYEDLARIAREQGVSIAEAAAFVQS